MSDIIFKTLLLKGEAGNNIIDIKKTSSDDLVDTYTITRTDGVTTTFNITNGNGIKSILKTDSNGLVDTYTITYDNGKTNTLEVKNGEGATVIIDNALSKTSTNPVQNKVITNSINDIGGQICTNLLNPTAKTQTINGVTFTNNGDGTYSVNGTCTGDYALLDFASANIKGKCKLVGCPKGGSLSSSFVLYKVGSSVSPQQMIDTGNGVIIDTNESNALFRIVIYGGYTANNLLFKPMLTTDLSATYDDFVPYTGGSGRLNEDVANLVDLFNGISAITNSDIDTILNS